MVFVLMPCVMRVIELLSDVGSK